MGFVLTYYLLFCYDLLLSLRSLLFSKERQKEGRLGWKGELGGVEWGEAVIRIYCMRKDSILNKHGVEGLSSRGLQVGWWGSYIEDWGSFLPDDYWERKAQANPLQVMKLPSTQRTVSLSSIRNHATHPSAMHSQDSRQIQKCPNMIDKVSMEFPKERLLARRVQLNRWSPYEHFIISVPGTTHAILCKSCSLY